MKKRSILVPSSEPPVFRQDPNLTLTPYRRWDQILIQFLILLYQKNPSSDSDKSKEWSTLESAESEHS